MQKKFALTNETRVFGKHILYRIKALKDFADIKEDTLGGLLKRKITSLMRAIAGSMMRLVSMVM